MVGKDPLEIALRLATEYKRSIIPTKGSKIPYVTWTPYQTTRATAEQITQWASQFTPSAWAMVTGAVSETITLDFDTEIGRNTCKKLGIDPHRETGSKGLQADFRHPGWPVKSLNHISCSKKTWTREYPSTDIRADKGITLIAGSNKNGPYIWLRTPDLYPLDILPLDLREMLGLLHPPKEQQKPPKQKREQQTHTSWSGNQDLGTRILELFLAASTSGRNNACFQMGCQLRDNGFSESEAERIAVEFASRVSPIDQHGKHDPFTDQQAKKCITSAYSHTAREPWEVKRPSSSQERSESIHQDFASREEQEEKLASAKEAIEQSVKNHIAQKETRVLIECVPPGVGKSHIMGIMANEFNMAWIAPNHKQIKSVDIKGAREIMACTPENCRVSHLHTILRQKGYPTKELHELETETFGGPCNFSLQWDHTSSAIYQIAHLLSRHPYKHDIITIDEFNVTNYLPERKTDISHLQADITRYDVGSASDKFLRALQALLTSTETPIHGKAVLDALDQLAKGQLTNWLAEIDRELHQYVIELDLTDPDIKQTLERKTDVLMPHLVKSFLSELAKWQRGQEWNSCIRVGKSTFGHALYITEPFDFRGSNPITILDATADQEIHSRLLGCKLNIHKIDDIGPIEGTRHIAVRTGKYYGKRDHTRKFTHEGTSSEELLRTVKECRYMLNKYDPDGEAIINESVGLISFKDCVGYIGEQLSIPKRRQGHYGAVRGLNDLEDCQILLLVGTHTLAPDDVIRQARAIYRDDPEPLNPEVINFKYTDPRIQRYANYLTNAELTQAAHRSRVLRNPNRIVVSFCMGTIDYLPITELYTNPLPHLSDQGKSCDERIADAYDELSKDGKQPSQREIATRAKVSLSGVGGRLKSHSASYTSSHGKYCYPNPINNSYKDFGNSTFHADMRGEENADSECETARNTSQEELNQNIMQQMNNNVLRNLRVIVASHPERGVFAINGEWFTAQQAYKKLSTCSDKQWAYEVAARHAYEIYEIALRYEVPKKGASV